ncbi:MAG: hypothetical protein RLZZ627_973 [Pseudomonadota bacterium]|jgi:hypothetical protein
MIRSIQKLFWDCEAMNGLDWRRWSALLLSVGVLMVFNGAIATSTAAPQEITTANESFPADADPEAWGDAEKPQTDTTKGDRHLGVASCAGSNCHGATRPYLSSSVEQNEYTIWNREDPHSRAYLVLLNERSKKIARNLGLKKPANESKICLDCHADNVPMELRGKRFDVTDGVGCEACHGGGNRYLGPHVSGEVTHADNIKNGLYPTENPEKRADMCNKCHVGDEERFANHRIMGAGHPRISFELDTYTEVHKHYVADKDYFKRKEVVTHAGIWALGQVRASIRFVDLFLHGKHQSSGLMPELSFFDCQACHHDIEVPSDAFGQNKALDEQAASSKLVWEKRSISGVGPGTIRFNDSGLLMTAILADAIAPQEATRIRQLIGELHKASQSDAHKMRQVAETLQKTLQDIEPTVAHHTFNNTDCAAILASLAERSRQNDYLSFAAAEQVVMAVEAMRATLQQNGDTRIGDAAMNALRAATVSTEAYRPAAFREALQSLGGSRGH